MESLLDELAARFGAENVRVPADTGADTYTGWYPVAIKQRQGGEMVPPPAAIVQPANVEEVAALRRYANDNKIVLLPVGGGSNTVGSTVPNSPGTVAVDLSRLQTVAWDETALCVTAGAGVVLAGLEDDLNRHGYSLGSVPQSGRIATVGGAVATNAYGLFAAGYGSTRDNTLAIEAVAPNGEIVKTSANGATGRLLHHQIIGAESSGYIITSATLAIRTQPEVRAWGAFSFARFDDAADALRLLYRSDARPACVRLFDPAATREKFAEQIPDGSAVLLFAVEGSEVVQTGIYQTAFAVCKQVGGTESTIDGDAWHDAERYRTDAFAANARPGAIADVLSIYAPWTQLSAFYYALIAALRPDTSELSAQIGYATAHGAAIDTRFVAETASPLDAIARHERIIAAAKEVAESHDAQVAHHYGVGRTYAM